MNNTIFVSEKWMKDNLPIPSNLDVKEIYPFMTVSQDKWIRDVLGDELYDRMCDAVDNNNLSADELKLMELIYPTAAYYALYEAVPFLANKIKNIGIVQTTDDKQTRSDRADIKELRQQVQNNAEYYMVRLNKYLCKHHALYPQYNYTNDDVNPNNASGYNCGISFDKCFIDEKFIKQYYRQ